MLIGGHGEVRTRTATDRWMCCQQSLSLPALGLIAVRAHNVVAHGWSCGDVARSDFNRRVVSSEQRVLCMGKLVATVPVRILACVIWTLACL
jgi:hypothetical protein